MIIVEPGNPTAPEVTALLQQSHEMMEALFPSDSNHYLSVEALMAPHIHFFTAREREQVLGTAALAVMAGYGEVKSMYVTEAARRRGVGDALLRQVEDQARALKLPLLRLETGNKLNAAARLYGRHGFEFCDAFGAYDASPSNLFMEKRLD